MLFRVLSSWVLKISKAGKSTVSLGSLVHSLTVVRITFSLCLLKISYCTNVLPLDVILRTSGKSPALPCLVVGQELDSPLSFSPGKLPPLYVVCFVSQTGWPYTELLLVCPYFSHHRGPNWMWHSRYGRTSTKYRRKIYSFDLLAVLLPMAGPCCCTVDSCLIWCPQGPQVLPRNASMPQPIMVQGYYIFVFAWLCIWFAELCEVPVSPFLSSLKILLWDSLALQLISCCPCFHPSRFSRWF